MAIEILPQRQSFFAEVSGVDLRQPLAAKQWQENLNRVSRIRHPAIPRSTTHGRRAYCLQRSFRSCLHGNELSLEDGSETCTHEDGRYLQHRKRRRNSTGRRRAPTPQPRERTLAHGQYLQICAGAMFTASRKRSARARRRYRIRRYACRLRRTHRRKENRD